MLGDIAYLSPSETPIDTISSLAGNLIGFPCSFLPHAHNITKGDYAIDWSTDTRDGGRHLNCKGAEKVSAYLGKYISENYSFKDKRHSEKYADWNNDYLDYVKYMSGETVSLEAQQSDGTVSNN